MREFIRHPSSVPIQLEELNNEIRLGRITLNNVSFGGIACLCEKPVETGTTIRMRVECIDPDFEITGKTVWCKAQDEAFEIGIEFIMSQDQIFLLRMVEQISHIEHYRNEIFRTEKRTLSSEDAAREWIEKHAENFPEINNG